MRRRRTGAQDRRNSWSIKPRKYSPSRSKTPSSEKHSAWLGLVGVVLGAVLAGVTTLIAIIIQSTQETNQFIRDQRLEAYTTFMDDEQQLWDSVTHFKYIVFSPGEQPNAPFLTEEQRVEFDQLKQPIREAYDRMRRMQAKMEIFGTPEAAEVSRKIVAEYESRNYHYEQLVAQIERIDWTDPGEAQRFSEAWDNVMRSYERLANVLGSRGQHQSTINQKIGGNGAGEGNTGTNTAGPTSSGSSVTTVDEAKPEQVNLVEQLREICRQDFEVSG